MSWADKPAAGIVLCGGKSTRMGVPKATLPFGPETMLQRVVRLLGTVVAPIVAVAAREQTLPDLPPGVLVTRDEREAKGPLEGLRAGLAALPAEVDSAYITSCDVPLLVPGFVERMVEQPQLFVQAMLSAEPFAPLRHGPAARFAADGLRLLELIARVRRALPAVAAQVLPPELARTFEPLQRALCELQADLRRSRDDDPSSDSHQRAHPPGPGPQPARDQPPAAAVAQ